MRRKSGPPTKPKSEKLNPFCVVNCKPDMAARARARRRALGVSFSAQFVAAMLFWEEQTELKVTTKIGECK